MHDDFMVQEEGVIWHAELGQAQLNFSIGDTVS